MLINTHLSHLELLPCAQSMETLVLSFASQATYRLCYLNDTVKVVWAVCVLKGIPGDLTRAAFFRLKKTFYHNIFKMVNCCIYIALLTKVLYNLPFIYPFTYTLTHDGSELPVKCWPDHWEQFGAQCLS